MQNILGRVLEAKGKKDKPLIIRIYGPLKAPVRVTDMDAVQTRLSNLDARLTSQISELWAGKEEPIKAKPLKAKPKARGVFCRNCAKPLEGRQKVFCTRKCAAVWHGQHQGEIATPRLEINEKPEAVVEAGVGVVKGSVSENGKKVEEVAAV